MHQVLLDIICDVNSHNKTITPFLNYLFYFYKMENIQSWFTLERAFFFLNGDTWGNFKHDLKISPNINTELVENMKCKVKDVAMVTEQEVAICKKY